MSETLPLNQIPHVTIIRPVKGLEPKLYQCLAATYHQTYPKDKLTIYLCVSSRDDPALPTLERVVEDFRDFDTKLLIEDDDPFLKSEENINFGPNPKIRNMSRAYREAKGDIVWIIDCNAWVGKGVAGRMVDTLCGLSRSGAAKKYKFVHQLPIVMDVTNEMRSTHKDLLGSQQVDDVQAASTSTSASDTFSDREMFEASLTSRMLQLGGTQLEELFLSSSHAKFYTAINTVLVAPCIIGKSNMFRRSHLDYLTSNTDDDRPPGIDFFSHNICEDHLIGDLLWKNTVQEETGNDPERLGKHALLFGDLAIQPMAGMSVSEYIARRVRWLRVRKFTVTLATLVEPGIESFLCSLYGAYALTSLPWIYEGFGIQPTWTTFVAFWFANVILWIAVDWTLYLILHSASSIEVDENTPDFARGPYRGQRKSFGAWALAWLGRETLALPIWSLAVYGGVTVAWRGKKFRVGLDARVRAIEDQGAASLREPHFWTANGNSKSRRE